MKYNFKNIIDLFLYAKEQNMCTTLFCTTCGAMEFRHMCIEIGKVEIKRLIECVTDEEIKQIPESLTYWDWYDPLRLLQYEGFHAEPNCPMMRWFSEGDVAHRTTCTKKLIYEMGRHKVFGIIGSIFNNSECEVTAIFQNNEGSAFSKEMEIFFIYYPFVPFKGGVKESFRMPPHVRAIYYGRAFETSADIKKVKCMIDGMLSLLSSKGYRSVAMNAVVTNTNNPSELDNINIIEEWFKQHPESPIHIVHLVDKRGGFNSLNTSGD